MTTTTKSIAAAIKRHMNAIVEGHVDPKTGEVNCTGLAEATAHHFGHDEWLDDDTHVLWDLAIDVSQAFETGRHDESLSGRE